MQYEPTLSRGELIDLAIHKYFGSVDKKDMEGTLDCFNEEAMLCTQTSFTRHAGKPAIRRMFEGLFGAYDKIIHKDFICTVDEGNGRITACFVAELTDPQGKVVTFNNTNFWRVRDGRFQEVYVYFSGENVLV